MPPSKRRTTERRTGSALASPEVQYVKHIHDYRLEQLERDQAGGIIDTADVADDVLGEMSDSDVEASKKKKPRQTKLPSSAKHRGTRQERRSLDELLADEKVKQGDTFLSILVKPSKYPSPTLCSVCLQTSKYKCMRCSLRYCSPACLKIHSETKCVKFGA